MTLRKRGYLNEATERHDRKVRQVAHKFYRSLIAFTKAHPDKMTLRDDGGYGVAAKEFWKHPRAKDLLVIITGKRKGVGGAIGKHGGKTVMLLPVMYSSGNADRLHQDLKWSEDTVVHEMIHYLDPGFEKAKGHTLSAQTSVDKKSYYNDPGEWNAFWQAGAHKFHQSYRDRDSRDMWTWGESGVRTFKKLSLDFWDSEFLANMNSKTERKFDKRLYQLWKAFIDRVEREAGNQK